MAISNKNLIDSMIQGIQRKDPKLYEILSLMSDDLGALLDDIRPIIAASSIQGAALVPPPVPIDAICLLYNIGIRLQWAIDPAYEADVALYDVRKGVDWDAAERVTKTAAFNVFLNPLPSGLHTYLIKSVSRAGIESLTYATVEFTVANPGTTVVVADVIDNNVLLMWVTPSSTFKIDYCEITRDGVVYGKVAATFFSIFETVGGTYRYGVKGVDIAGNVGPEVYIDAIVNQPPDYELVDLHTSTFDGTKSNCIVEDGQLWAIIETAKTWETHFTSQGWDQINDQLLLGFDHYLEPSGTTGYYEEEIDFGGIFNNVIINLDWDVIELSGSVTITGQIETSTDGINWSAPVVGASVYASTLRYARVRLTFSGSDGDDLFIINSFRIMMDVKKETDSGSVTALSTDAGGTEVTFNKTFKDVNSITLTTNSIQPITAVYDFTDVPNPTSFKILVFDSAGYRITYPVSWKARGVT